MRLARICLSLFMEIIKSQLGLFTLLTFLTMCDINRDKLEQILVRKRT